MQTIAYIIIGLMCSALATYSAWWLFFSDEAILNIINMGSYNESNASIEKNLETLIKERDALEAELVSDYSEEKLRKVNILDHHIRVAMERVTGQWKKDGCINEHSIIK